MTVQSAVRDFVQVVVSSAIGWGVGELVHYEAKLPGNMLIYVSAATAIYYAAVSALERKYPRWAWLLYLLPSKIPTPVPPAK